MPATATNPRADKLNAAPALIRNASYVGGGSLEPFNPVPPYFAEQRALYRRDPFMDQFLQDEPGYADIHTFNLIVTPEMAKEILERYYYAGQQRPWKKKNIAYQVNIQTPDKNGLKEFRAGSDLVFGCYRMPNGEDYFALVDGNHSTRVVYLNNRAQSFTVKCYRMESEHDLGRLYRTYNSDCPRSTKEKLDYMPSIFTNPEIENNKRAINQAYEGVKNLACNFRYHGSANQRMQVGVKYDFAKKYAVATEAYILLVYGYNTKNRRVKERLKSLPFQTACTQLFYYQPEAAEQFVTGLLDFENIEDANDARKTLGEILNKIHVHGFNPDYLIRLLFRAWDAWVNERTLHITVETVSSEDDAVKKKTDTSLLKDFTVQHTPIDTVNYFYDIDTFEWVSKKLKSKPVVA